MNTYCITKRKHYLEPLSKGTVPERGYFHRLLTDVLTLGRSKDYVRILKRQMHSSLFYIWLEYVASQGGLSNEISFCLKCLFALRFVSYPSDPRRMRLPACFFRSGSSKMVKKPDKVGRLCPTIKATSHHVWSAVRRRERSQDIFSHS